MISLNANAWMMRQIFCEEDADIIVTVVCVCIPFNSYVNHGTLSYVENSCFIQFHPIAPHKSVTMVGGSCWVPLSGTHAYLARFPLVFTL